MNLKFAASPHMRRYNPIYNNLRCCTSCCIVGSLQILTIRKINIYKRNMSFNCNISGSFLQTNTSTRDTKGIHRHLLHSSEVQSTKADTSILSTFIDNYQEKIFDESLRYISCFLTKPNSMSSSNI